MGRTESDEQEIKRQSLGRRYPLADETARGRAGDPGQELLAALAGVVMVASLRYFLR